MFATRKVLVPLVAAAAVATGLTAAGPASRAEAAVPTTIPLEFKNNSGRGDQIYVYNIGTELSTGRQGWADANGTFHAWPAGGNPPTPAPDASIAGPANGQTMTLRMPKFSGRVYFSYGQKLVFRLTTGGLVQPAVQNPSDPNANILFNWTEYTLNDSGLWLNSTQVDMFSAPYAVGVKNTAGPSRTPATSSPVATPGSSTPCGPSPAAGQASSAPGPTARSCAPSPPATASSPAPCRAPS